MHSIQQRNSRTLSTSSDSSTDSTSSSSGKLMSISSIIAAPPLYNSAHLALATQHSYNDNPMERRASAPSYSYNDHSSSQYPSNPPFRSPPTSPGKDKYLYTASAASPSSHEKSPYPIRYYNQTNHHLHYSIATPPHLIKSGHNKEQQQQQFLVQPKSTDDFIMGADEVDAIIDDQGQLQPPLTLQERRLRNKAASAKYRQKKNQQQNEMRLMISRLSEQNAVLERQLQEVRLDNERLRATADRLRGKMVAKRMLKKWIGKQSITDSAPIMNSDKDNVSNQQQQQTPLYNTTHTAANMKGLYAKPYPYKNASDSKYTCAVSSVSSGGSEQGDSMNRGLLTGECTTDLDGEGEGDELESMDSD